VINMRAAPAVDRSRVRRSSIGLTLLLAAVTACGQPADRSGGEGGGGEGGGVGTGGSGGAGGGSGGGGSSATGGASGSGGSATTGGAGGSVGAGGTGDGPANDAAVSADGEAPDAQASSDATGPSSVPAPSAACAGGAVMPGPNGTQTIQSAGKSRTFIIRMPTGYDGKRPLPLMFAFHGAGAGAAAFEGGAFGAIGKMAADKAVRLFPQAFGNTWSRDEPDDVMFMDAILAWLGPKVCYDTARVYATGHSSGAYFSHRFACDRGNLIRAVATNSGGQRKERILDCKIPVSAWMSTGSGDNPGHVLGTQQARDVWIKLAGCSTKGVPTTPSPCLDYPGCRPGFKVNFCQHGGGHALPGFAAGAIYNFLFGSMP
jgi:poly(3-hydroxybutyrate) depolymerase